MFDVLVFLFESLYPAEIGQDHAVLARKLIAAGFGEEEIRSALDWLAELLRRQARGPICRAPSARSYRSYTAAEMDKLSAESRGFLGFLESAGVLPAPAREAVIELAMALPGDGVEPERIKIVVLMVLWASRLDLDALILDELLPEGEKRLPH